LRCYRQDVTTPRPLSVLAEIVEFSISHAPDERVPFVWCELENLAITVTAIANSDPTIGQVRDFDAVSVGETQRALDPVST
jgi:hypothetical protein